MVTRERWLQMKERMESDPEFYKKYLGWVKKDTERNRVKRETDPKSWYAKRRAWYKEYYQKKRLDPEWVAKFNESQRNHRARQRFTVIAHYSNGVNTCACCGEQEYCFLTIDHIGGNGWKHRKQIGHKSIDQWLIENGFPEGFQVLCYNCNFAKAHNGNTCPHKEVV